MDESKYFVGFTLSLAYVLIIMLATSQRRKVTALTCSPRGVSDDGTAGPVALAVSGAHFEEVFGLRLHIPDDGGGDVAHDGLDKPLAVLRPPVHRVLDHVTVDAPVRKLRRPP